MIFSIISCFTCLLCRPSFHDVDRLRTLINSLATDLAMSIADSGHAYAMTTAASSLTPASRFGELFSGLSQVSTVLAPQYGTKRFTHFYRK